MQNIVATARRMLLCMYRPRLKLELLLFLAPRGLHVLQLAYPFSLGEQPHNRCYLSLYPDDPIVTNLLGSYFDFGPVGPQTQ